MNEYIPNNSRFLPALAMYAMTALPDVGWGSWDTGYRYRRPRPEGQGTSKAAKKQKAQRKARRLARRK